MKDMPIHPNAGSFCQACFDAARGIAILVGIFLFGGWLHKAGVPIPGGVLGLLLFYFALQLGLIKLHWVERGANLLLRHMVLLFVPLTVGLIGFGSTLKTQGQAILASLFISFVAVLLTTGLLGRWLLPADEKTPGTQL
jgi:holin-like protein